MSTPTEPVGSPPPANPPPPTASAQPPRRLSAATMIVVGVLVLIPCVALAAVPTYSHETPKLMGWPFFYWYQVLWVFITPVLTYTAYIILKRARGERRASESGKHSSRRSPTPSEGAR
jgi:hypothetical protein